MFYAFYCEYSKKMGLFCMGGCYNFELVIYEHITK